MHSSRGLLVPLLPLLLLLVAAAGPARALSDDERRVMVEQHNLYRAQVSPSAANMLQMVSSPEALACWDGRGAGQGPSPIPPTPKLELSRTRLSDSPLRSVTEPEII